MSKRKAMSKRLRFEILKRDGFACQYCSAKPPKVPLEIDHILPVSKGGDNSIDNLITSCYDCNRGKSNIELDSIPTTLSEKTERRRLAQEQYKQYKKFVNEQEKIINDEIDKIESVYSSCYKDYIFTDRFRITVKKFVESLGYTETLDSMERACNKIYSDEDAVLKYFCGICWNKIKGDKFWS